MSNYYVYKKTACCFFFLKNCPLRKKHIGTEKKKLLFLNIVMFKSAPCYVHKAFLVTQSSKTYLSSSFISTYCLLFIHLY